MPQRICKGCGREFIPNTSKQQFCNNEITKKCEVCGSEFTYICNSMNHSRTTCSYKCARQLGMTKSTLPTRKCKWCNKEFIPRTSRQMYCDNTHYQKCVVCGKEFEIIPAIDNTVKTCSKDCRYKLASSNHDFDAVMRKQRATLRAKYGVNNAMQIDGVVDKVKATNLKKYGIEHLSHCPEVKRRMTASLNPSKLERRICDLFDNYNIEYTQHHFISNNEMSHEFDFYLPKYKILIDAD